VRCEVRKLEMGDRPVTDPKKPYWETFVPEIAEIAEPDRMLVGREARHGAS
jgi:hypothetical protein